MAQLLREVSGDETTRIKSAMSSELELAMLQQGVRVFLGLGETDMYESVRLFRAGSKVAALVDILTKPDSTADKELAQTSDEIKGKWAWNEPAEGS